MTVSYWRRTAAWPEPSLASRPPAACDVAIIGAGICGLSAALHLERGGRTVVVLDREGVAAGASGRNAGFLMRGCADNYLVACREYGRERARFLWRLTEQTLAGLRAEGIEEVPTVRRVPSCLLAFEERERAELRESVDLLRADGFEVGWIDPPGPDDGAWRSASPALGALVNPNDGAANSVDVLRFLASRLRAPVVAPAPVRAIRPDGAGVRVETDAGEVRCDRALLCANAYAPLLAPALGAIVVPRRGQMLALRPTPRDGAPGPRLAMSYYANRGYEYFRQPVADDGTIVAGGWRARFAATEVGYDDAITSNVQGGIESFVTRAIGLRAGEYDVTDRWSGVMGFSSDGLPKIVPLGFESGSMRVGENSLRILPPDAPPTEARVWFIGAYTGHGMSMGFETARLAVGLALGETPAKDNPFPAAPGRGG